MICKTIPRTLSNHDRWTIISYRALAFDGWPGGYVHLAIFSFSLTIAKIAK